MATGDLTTVADVKAAAGVTDASTDAWFATIVAAVSGAIELFTGRWLAPRGSLTLCFDIPGRSLGFQTGANAFGSATTLRVPRGLQSISYIGTAWQDQPDDGSGTYLAITAGVYLQPPVQERPADGWPATAVELGYLSNAFFYPGHRTAKITGSWGWAAVPPRVAQIATTAVVRAWRAKTSGGADYAIIGPDGGMRIMRDLAPAELAELGSSYRDPVAG
jgi:hypothetical protein